VSRNATASSRSPAMSRFFICTFGCRCNQADSGAIRESLLRKGLLETAGHSEADLVVINTCTVTQRTDQQVRQMVRRVQRDNPCARLVVTGCYAERDPYALSAIPGVSLTVGNAEREHLADLLEEGVTPPGLKVIHSPLGGRDPVLEMPLFEAGGKTRPLVKIQDGCDARCSYCIVPSVRGPGRSARAADIVGAIKALVTSGYREIVLTGVNLGAYGRKLGGSPTLVDLLQMILEIPGLGRLRLSSIEPMRFSRGIIRLAASNAAIAPHFHIPVQSGSDRVLRRMRRPYTAARFLSLAESIRESLPFSGIGTDVLVGFPGENDEDFQKTCDLVQRAPLTYLHVFPFSVREGTAAGALVPRVPASLIRERVKVLCSISQEKNLKFRRSLIGRELSAITLAGEENVGDSMVLTGNYIHARVAGPVDPNQLVNVRILDASKETTEGTVV
jgi:threonylcarbamoyladenosine tRNA methylthiotransferase MtaB